MYLRLNVCHPQALSPMYVLSCVGFILSNSPDLHSVLGQYFSCLNALGCRVSMVSTGSQYPQNKYNWRGKGIARPPGRFFNFWPLLKGNFQFRARLSPWLRFWPLIPEWMCHCQLSSSDWFSSGHCWGVSPASMVLLRRTVMNMGFNKAFKFILDFRSCYFYKIHFPHLLWVPQDYFHPGGHLVSLIFRI